MEKNKAEVRTLTVQPIVFTVIVAVYNAQRTIDRCLQSLLQQTLDAFEVICVDDFSTDNSLERLARYALGDSRIRVVTLIKNSGPAHARNVALSQARGQYVCFLDSDDWMSADALQQVADCFARHDDTDCVLFRVVNVEEDGRAHDYPMMAQRYDGRTAFIHSLTWALHGCYAVRTALHKATPYDETCRTYSDDNTTRMHYLRSRYVDCCQGVYYYWQHAGSITHTQGLSRFDYLKATASMRRQIIEARQPDEIVQRYEAVRWLVVVDCFGYYCKHKDGWTRGERLRALAMLRAAWRDIHFNQIASRYKRKLGYRPFSASWCCFYAQERLYFFLKRLLRR